MGLKFTNFARAKLATPPTGTTGLTFTVEAGKGALFPTLAAGDYFYGVFKNATKVNNEIVKVEARSTDSFTIATGARGSDGTTAQTWTTNDYFELAMTRASLLEAFNAAIAALGTLTPAADVFGYFTSATQAALTSLTAYSRTLLAAADAAAARVVLEADNGKPIGRCQLVYTNSTTLTLNRKDGRHLFINGVWREIAGAGVTLSNATALIEGGSPSANTTYLVYAEWSGSAVVLKLSATAHATDATYGHEIRSGDATRTLVGIVRLDASAQFVSSVTKRLVRSYFYRVAVDVANSLASGNVGTATLPWLELNSVLRCEFVAFADDIAFGACNCLVENTGTNNVYLGIAFDSTSAPNGYTTEKVAASANQFSLSAQAVVSLTEGYHYATLLGGVSGGTGTYEGASGYTRQSVQITGPA